VTARAFLRPFLLARDFLLTLLALPFLFPLRVLPWTAACALGSFYGLVAWAAMGTARRAGLVNLRRAYGPGMSRAAAGRKVRAVFANLGRSLAEGARFSAVAARGDRSWETLYDAEDPALEARILADPRPKVFVTGHLGSWEVAMQMLDLRLGGRGAAVARRVDNPFLDALLRRVRRGGGEFIEKTGAVAPALAALRSGTSVAILLDENGGRSGPFPTFFGRPASTRKTPALLSALTGAPIVVGAAVRRGGRFLFRLALLEPPGSGNPTPRDVLASTDQIVRVWESWVREDPLQWRWIHWRWKTRPDGSQESYTRRDVRDTFADEAPRPAEVSA
jgi:KDO2-lipid IV(A) lauroyltransferase